jgi:hypothetical protein
LTNRQLHMFESRDAPTSDSQDDLDSGYVDLREYGSIDIPCKTIWPWSISTVKVRDSKLVESASRWSCFSGHEAQKQNAYVCTARPKYRRYKYNHLKNEFQGFLKVVSIYLQVA